MENAWILAAVSAAGLVMGLVVVRLVEYVVFKPVQRMFDEMEEEHAKRSHHIG